MHRRTLLRATAGIAVGLPALECMFDGKGEAHAGGGAVPRRYGIVFAGQSLGGDGWAKNASRVAGVNIDEDGHFIAPTQAGVGYALTTPLMPLADLVDDFTIVSGLAIPWNPSPDTAAPVPSGGAFRQFHGGVKSPLLSGMRSLSGAYICNGATSDQIMAQTQARATTHPSLVFRAQPSFYLAGYGFDGREYISYSGPGMPVEAHVGPQAAYQTIFGTFTPDNAEDLAILEFNLRTRRSVLDLITAKRERVLGRVGNADRVRLEKHFDEIRALENRLSAIEPEGACAAPADPGVDPPEGDPNAGSGSGEIQPNTGWSDEKRRSELLADFIHMAFTCDLTRVATLQITAFQSHMNVSVPSEDLGVPIRADLHEVGHNGDADNRGQIPVSTCLRWHVERYAYLVAKLRDTEEGASTLLDHTTLLFVPEGGHGTQLDDGFTPDAAHSVEEMCILLAGGRAGGITSHGSHIETPGLHPARVLVSAMQAAGWAGDTLGEVTGNVPAMFA